MDTDLKAKWVADLRTTDKKQGKGYLRNNDGEWCCLGRLCDIIAPDEWEPEITEVEVHGDDLFYQIYRHREKVGIPAQSLRDEAGLTLQTANDLAAMNDMGKTFAEIADYIEATL